MLEGIKILAADDDVMSLEMLATILGSQGVHCTTVSNGKEAMDELESNPDFDIVLLDLQMPTMDGFEVLSQCKGNPYLCEIPIIVIASGHHEKLKSLKLGADDFMAKPYDLDELKLRISKLVQSRRLVACAKQAKSEFLAIASSELKNPMHQLIEISELLNGENMNTKQQEIVAQLQKATESLTGLIRNILDYVQLDQGAAKASMEPFSLRATVQAAIETCMEVANKKGISFEVAIGDNVSDTLDGASLYVSRIFNIFIKNALNFSAPGEIRIVIGEESLGKFGSMFCCSVSASGIEIPIELQDKIFEPFAHLDSPGSQIFKSIGLSLAIAKRMVELMGGAVSIRSDEGTGSYFYFTFHCHLQSVAMGAVKQEISA